MERILGGKASARQAFGEKYADVVQAADFLKITRKAVYGLVYRGLIKPSNKRTGSKRKLVFRYADLESYLEGKKC